MTDPLFSNPILYVDVKADGNYGHWLIVGLLGMGEDSRLVVRYQLLKELGKFSEDYTWLFGGMEKFEELRMSLHVDGLTKVCKLCFCFLILNFTIKFGVYICFI